MQQCRAGERGRLIPLRAERFYKLGDDWYFLVRGGKSFGPYRCRAEAETAVHQFFCQRGKSSGVIFPFGRQHRRRWNRNHRL